MIVAYAMSGHENGAFYFEEAPEDYFCNECGCVVRDDFFPERLLNLNGNIGSFSTTYDGKDIVSLNFKNFCEQLPENNLIFQRVNLDPALFFITATKVLSFDSERRKTKFEEYCKKCSQYSEIAGVTPGFLLDTGKPIDEGFFITDIKFGSYKNQNNVLIVGVKTKEQIEKAGFKNILFSPMYGSSEKVMINSKEF